MKKFIALAIVMLASCNADEHQHAPGMETTLHELFYQHWMMPDRPGASCCNKKDCFPTFARFSSGSWYALARDRKTWVRVPPEKIDSRSTPPDLGAHVCMSESVPPVVHCFIPGVGA